MQYSLSAHAFACATKRYWIVLDTRSDRYFCLQREHFEPLAAVIHELRSRVADVTARHGPLPVEAVEVARSLLERGILNACSPGGNRAPPPDPLHAPTDVVDGDYRQADASARAIYLPRFLRACHRADFWLRRRSLDWTISKIASRARLRRQPETDFDIERATRLIRAFNALRPVYPRDYLCMFDSLALLEFLAASDIGPRWVFGVCADPFKAHCWLQTGDLLLNDTLSTVSVYTPIMSV